MQQWVDSGGDRALQAVLSYAFKAGENSGRQVDTLLDILTEALPESRENIMTIEQVLEQRGFSRGMQNGFHQGRQEGMQEGRQEGIQEGRQEGMQNGIKEGMRQVAQRMLRLGSSTKDIIHITGLSASEVEKILQVHE